jgi:hypothetical protein
MWMCSFLFFTEGSGSVFSDCVVIGSGATVEDK